MNKFLVCLAASVLVGSPVMAQDAQITDVLNAPTTTAEGMTFLAKHYDVPGGWATPPHRHGGDVIAYVVEGEAVIDLDGELTPLGAGDALSASPEQVMIMRNGSDSERLIFLVHQVGPADAPYVEMAE